jgi:hypothetical protein
MGGKSHRAIKAVSASSKEKAPTSGGRSRGKQKQKQKLTPSVAPSLRTKEEEEAKAQEEREAKEKTVRENIAIRKVAKKTQKSYGQHYITEERYDLVRWLRRIGYRYPGRLGLLQPDYICIQIGPLLPKKKLYRTNADIKVAVSEWVHPCTRVAAEVKYGHISDWQTSQVTDMSKLFYVNPDMCVSASNFQTFNDDISRWDTSNVTNISYMFYAAHSSNRNNMRTWNLSRVTHSMWVFPDMKYYNFYLGWVSSSLV